jgi:hypothetical protein
VPTRRMSRSGTRIGGLTILSVLQIVGLRGVRLGLDIGRYKALAGCVRLISAFVRRPRAAPAARLLLVLRLVARLVITLVAITMVAIAGLGVAGLMLTVVRTVLASIVLARTVLAWTVSRPPVRTGPVVVGAAVAGILVAASILVVGRLVVGRLVVGIITVVVAGVSVAVLPRCGVASLPRTALIALVRSALEDLDHPAQITHGQAECAGAHAALPDAEDRHVGVGVPAEPHSPGVAPDVEKHLAEARQRRCIGGGHEAMVARTMRSVQLMIT